MAEDVPLSPPPPLIPFLLDDISARCIARVPVTSHTALSHVSRSWRSFVRSPSFFSLRSELAVTELVLTVGIITYHTDRYRWYHLRPYQTPFPLPPTLERKHDNGSVSASLGPHLFVIGSNSLQIYDGCLRRWSHGPPTSTLREFAAAGVAGGRIHVLDGCTYLPSAQLAESLDPAGTRWDPVPPIPTNLLGNWMRRSGVVDGKLLVLSGEDGPQLSAAAFDPDTAEWGPAPRWWVDSGSFGQWAVVGGVPYIFSYNMDGIVDGIVGYGNDGQWRLVEGESMMKLLYSMYDVRLLTFGGLLCLVGQERELINGFVIISCAGIDISRMDDGGFKGSIMWLDSSSLKHSVDQYLDCCTVMEL